MNNYIFVYKDSQGNLHTATSPRFIASHKSCVAVPTDVIESTPYDTWVDALYDINGTAPKHPEGMIHLIHSTDLKEIY